MLDQENLIFLISLPRSGSTFLQKILGSHTQIATVAEPWIMFPFVMALGQCGIRAEYGYKTLLKAHQILFNRLPQGEKDYVEAVRHSALMLYTRLSNGKPFFLDKTPPYYFILPQLYRVFPRARYIFLLRSPLSIFASALEGLHSNSLRKVDHLDLIFYRGPCLMAEGYLLMQEQAILVTYERLIEAVDEEIARILKEMDLSPETGIIAKSFQQQLSGLGDHLGAKEFNAIQDQRQKWKEVVDTPWRAFFLRQFLRNVDNRYLEMGSYDRSTLLTQMEKVSRDQWRPMEVIWLIEVLMRRAVKKLLHRTYSFRE